MIPSLSNASAIARTSNNKIVVAADSVTPNEDVLKVYGFDENGVLTTPSDCASFAGESILGLEPAANDTLYATLVGGDHDRLVEIPFASCGATPTVTEIATFTGAGGSTPPVYGVAVPFATQENDNSNIGDFTFPAGTQAFGFGEQVYEYFTFGDDGDCVIEVTSHEVSAVELADVLDITDIDALPIVFEGENGRALLFDYDDNETCTDSNGYIDFAYDAHGINAYYSAFNPRIVLCHTAPGVTPGPADCELTPLVSTSSFGYLPFDERSGGRGSGRFSYSFLVETADVVDGEPQYDGFFCGFKSPLDDTTFGDPLFATGGSTVSVRFNAVTEDPRKGGFNCKKGPYVDEMRAVLSVSQIEPIYRTLSPEEIVIVGGGSSEEGRIVFNDPSGSKNVYELQLKLEFATGQLFEPGAVFEITVADSDFDANGKYFFGTQTAYVQIAN